MFNELFRIIAKRRGMVSRPDKSNLPDYLIHQMAENGNKDAQDVRTWRLIRALRNIFRFNDESEKPTPLLPINPQTRRGGKSYS